MGSEGVAPVRGRSSLLRVVYEENAGSASDPGAPFTIGILDSVLACGTILVSSAACRA